MNHAQTFQNLSPHCQEKCLPLLEKLDRCEHVNDNDAREALRTLSQECSHVSDPQMSQQACRLLSKAYSLDEPCTNFLLKAADPGYQHSIFDHADNCPMLLNVARKMEENYDFSQMIQKFVPFLHNKFQNTDCYKCIANIARDAYLSEQDAAELLKAETHPQQANLNDEIIRKLDQQANKLCELPDTCFATVMTHVGKTLQFTEQQVTYVSQIERSYNFNDFEIVNLLHRSMPDTSILPRLPQKTRQLLQQQEANTHDEVKKFLTNIQGVQLPADIFQGMSIYTNLIEQIETNPSNQPTDTELEQLGKLDDALKTAGRPDAMPARSKDWAIYAKAKQNILNDYASNKDKKLELMKKCQNKQHITIPEAVYLKTYLNKFGDVIPSMVTNNLHKCLASAPADLKSVLEQMEELVDSKTLATIENWLVQIESEQLTGKTYELPFLKDANGNSFQVFISSNNFEIRVADIAGEKALKAFYQNNFFEEDESKQHPLWVELAKFIANTKAGAPIPGNLTHFATRNHEGEDIVPKNEDERDMLYQADSIINPTHAKIHKISENSKGWDVVTLEFNALNGALFTTYRHMAKATVSEGQKIKTNTPIGLFKDRETHSDIHIHVESVRIDIAALTEHAGVGRIGEDTIATLQNIFDDFSAQSEKYASQANSNNIDGDLMDSKLVQHVQRIGADDYAGVSWLSSGTSLNQYLLGAVEAEMLKHSQSLIQDNDITTPLDFVAILILNTGLRDQLTVAVVQKLLQESQKLFAPLDNEASAKLTALINRMQQTYDKLQSKAKARKTDIQKTIADIKKKNNKLT